MSKTTAEGPMKLSEKIKDKRYHDRKSVIISDNDLADWAKDASQLEQAQTWIPMAQYPWPKRKVTVLFRNDRVVRLWEWNPIEDELPSWAVEFMIVEPLPLKS